MEPMVNTQLGQTTEQIMEAFQAMDADRNGYISAADLLTVFNKKIGDRLTEEDALKMIQEADMDGDGLVNLEDFTKVCIYMVSHEDSGQSLY
jgi:calmodulin